MEFGSFKIQRSHGAGRFARGEFKSIGEHVVIEPEVLIFHPETISIGNHVYIGHRTILKGYYRETMSIGDHTWIGQGCFFHSGGGISIGKAVGIGPMVQIITSSHRDERLDLPVLHHPLEFKEVIVGDGCDIGIGSILLPGVKVGEGAIIGAGSVVTREVLPYTVVGGVPARLIRERSGGKRQR